MLPIDSFYKRTIKRILFKGNVVSPRGKNTKELLGVKFFLKNAKQNLLTLPSRNLNYTFSVAEWLWMLSGCDDVKSISYFNSKISEFSDDGLTFYGAYGPRIVEQLPHVISSLGSDACSRQAILVTWRKNPLPTKDVPCTISMQFLLRQNKLNAIVYMRSNDLWLGFPYDVFNFTRIQAAIAGEIGCGIGSYTHFVGSLHLYESNFEQAQAVLSETGKPRGSSPNLIAIPKDLKSKFMKLSDPETASTVEINNTSWDIYFGLLKHKTTKDSSLIKHPYINLMK